MVVFFFSLAVDLPTRDVLYHELQCQYPYPADAELPEFCPITIFDGLAEAWKAQNRSVFVDRLARKARILLRLNSRAGTTFTVMAALKHVVSKLMPPWSEADDALILEIRQKLTVDN